MATTLQSAAGTAAAVVEQLENVEPIAATVVGAFVPGARPIIAAVQPWAPLFLNYADRALKDVAASNGGDLESAFIELLQHIKAGQPNSRALS